MRLAGVQPMKIRLHDENFRKMEASKPVIVTDLTMGALKRLRSSFDVGRIVDKLLKNAADYEGHVEGGSRKVVGHFLDDNANSNFMVLMKKTFGMVEEAAIEAEDLVDRWVTTNVMFSSIVSEWKQYVEEGAQLIWSALENEVYADEWKRNHLLFKTFGEQLSQRRKPRQHHGRS